MYRTVRLLALLLFFAPSLVSCEQEGKEILLPQEEIEESEKPDISDSADNTENLEVRDVSGAYISDTISYKEFYKLTNYNFIYPSKDPWGNPIMLSGTISMENTLAQEKNARGIVLYNHYTVYRSDECPSRGKLEVQSMIAGSGLITIAPDYYGFGITEKEQQAYCIASVNAQAAVDALIYGCRLLQIMGFSWGSPIINVGYSQGGQTAIAVQRLVDEYYPDIHITRTMAGAGPYDLTETYRRFVQSEVAGMPSTVISVLLAFNKYYQVGLKREELFVEPTLSHIDDWILSKKYNRTEIDKLVASLDINSFATANMVDINSESTRRMMAALEKENLCRGWTPNKEDDIFLFHNVSDITVPYQCTINLYNFLTECGVEHVELVAKDLGQVYNQPAHESGAIFFISHVRAYICQILGINSW